MRREECASACEYRKKTQLGCNISSSITESEEFRNRSKRQKRQSANAGGDNRRGVLKVSGSGGVARLSSKSCCGLRCRGQPLWPTFPKLGIAARENHQLSPRFRIGDVSYESLR